MPPGSDAEKLMPTVKDRLSLLKRRLVALADRRGALHFLHLGKNAGTQIKSVAAHVNATSTTLRIIPHPHDTALRDLPADASYFFSIRMPDARFRSGFYSRKRKGLPRLFKDWTPHEAKAFADFPEANDLAESLFEEGPAGLKAMTAMKSISHCSMDQIGWFDRRGSFLLLHPPVGIVRQEMFDADMALLAQAAGFALPGHLDPEGRAAHRNDYAATPPLSEKARRNLRDWYRQDFEFYARCEDWIVSHGGAARSARPPVAGTPR